MTIYHQITPSIKNAIPYNSAAPVQACRPIQAFSSYLGNFIEIQHLGLFLELLLQEVTRGGPSLCFCCCFRIVSLCSEKETITLNLPWGTSIEPT